MPKTKLSKKEQELYDKRDKIIKECLRLKVSPLLFNAGAWYCGKHSFKLFFENL